MVVRSRWQLGLAATILTVNQMKENVMPWAISAN
jgi:hypothetical protein